MIRYKIIFWVDFGPGMNYVMFFFCIFFTVSNAVVQVLCKSEGKRYCRTYVEFIMEADNQDGRIQDYEFRKSYQK